MKQQYEDEIIHLRRQLEQRDGGRVSSPGKVGEGIPKDLDLKLLMPSSLRDSKGSLPNGREGLGSLGGMGSLGKDIQSKAGLDAHMSGADKAMRNGPSDSVKKEGADWSYTNNPQVQTKISVDMLHSLDHSSVVCCVKFSNDGKFLATGCNKAAVIYDVESGDKISTFTNEATPGSQGDSYVRSVCFSPDSKYLVAGAEDKKVKVWDIAAKRVQHTLEGHELDIYSLDFSFNGRFVVSGSGDRKAKLWDISTGKCQLTFGNDEAGPSDGVTSVCMSPDGTLVAAGSLDRIVRLWDTRSGDLIERFEGHQDSVYSVAFSPDGKFLASSSLDKTLRLWDLYGAASGMGQSRGRNRCRATFQGHKDFVLSVAFSPDGQWLVSGSKDRTVHFWDPQLPTTHLMLQGHKNSVISVAHSPVGKVFATGSGDNKVCTYTQTILCN
jgi:glucose repression regulatory protein TUP1